MKDEKIEIENKIKAPFTWVENDLIRSKSLSFQALGLYVTLRSFGKNAYPSVDYLCSLGNCGKDKIYKIVDELIGAKLLLKKQSMAKGHFSHSIYKILSLNADYKIIYKEFMQGDETPVNTQSQQVKIENLKAQNTHTSPPLKTDVSENLDKEKIQEEIQKLTLFKNDTAILRRLINKNLAYLTAAKFLNYKNNKGEITVKNPIALLISTLQNECYAEIEEEKIEKNEKITPDPAEQKIMERVKNTQREEEENLKIEKFIARMSEVEKQKILDNVKGKGGEIDKILIPIKFKLAVRKMILKS